MEELLTTDIWLQKCPNINFLLKRPFGSLSAPLGILKAYPEKVLAVARAIS